MHAEVHVHVHVSIHGTVHVPHACGALCTWCWCVQLKCDNCLVMDGQWSTELLPYRNDYY